MASKILCAGFSKEEKGAVEAEVKPVMAARPTAEAWTISLVKTGTRLAVTVDGPDDRIRGKNFVAELWELRQKLMDLLVNNGFPPVDGPAPAPPPSARKDPPSSPSIQFRKDPPSSPSIPKPMASAPPARPAPSPVIPKPMTSAPPIKAAPAKPAPAPARPAAMAPPITPPPQQRVSAPLTPPPSRIVSTPPSAPHQLEEEYDWESPHAAGERRREHQCVKCKRRYAVVYEALPNEPQMVVSVACPHCWEVDRIEIGENAALSKQYRADQLKD